MAFSTATPSPSAARAISRAKAAAALRTTHELPKSARLLGEELMAHSDRQTGLCRLSIASLAEALGFHERTVRRGIAALVQVGFLQVIKRGGQLTDEYHLLVGKLAALADDLAAQVQTICTAAARAAAAARAHVKAKTGNMLEAARAARRAAYEAAREARDRLKATASAPVSKPAETGPRTIPDRTFCPRILTMNIKDIHKRGKGLLSNFASQAGCWKAPGTPQGQALTDQQLDSKAYTRIAQALLSIGQAAYDQFCNHPDAASIQAEAIKAERYSPAQGRTGLAIIAARLNGVTA